MFIHFLKKVHCEYAIWLFLVSISFLSAQPKNAIEPTLITEEQGLPQSFVSDIIQGQKGFIWMATRDGLCRYDGQKFKVFQPNSSAKTSLSFPDPMALKLDHSGRIWIRSYAQDLDWFDPFHETFVNFSHLPFYQRNFGNDTLTLFYPDKRNRLWVCFAKRGLVSIDLRTYHYRSYPQHSASLSKSLVKGIVEDGQGVVWIATTTGLSRFDEQAGQFIQYKRNPDHPNALPDDELTGLYQHPNGSLAVLYRYHLTLFRPRTGQSITFDLAPKRTQQKNRFFFSDSKGNAYFYDYDELFKIDEKKGLQRLPIFPGSSSYIALFIDRSDVLWAGINGRGVLKYDLTANQFDNQPYKINFHSDLLSSQLGADPSVVTRLALRNSSFYFRSTWDHANRLLFNVGKSPFYRFDPQTKKLTAVPFPVSFDGQPTDQAAPLATDPSGTIWTIVASKLWRYRQDTGQWIHVPYPQLAQSNSKVNQLVVDLDAFWLSTNNGLYRLNRKNGVLSRYVHESKDSTSLSSNNLYCLSSDPTDDTILWIGTFGNGLCRFDKRTGSSRRLSTKDGLPNNVIYSAIPDKKGYLWISTNKGLCRLNRRTFEVQTYTTDDGLIGNEFNRYHFLHLPNDRIIMGGINGLTAFNPSEVRTDSYQPMVELTDIRINNRSVDSSPHNSTGELPARAISKLTLAHDQNYLNVEFANLQFNRINKNRYRYHMEGLDKDWIVVDRPVAIYTDLKPGHYALVVNGSNYSGVWSKYSRRLEIIIQPPWWATWWAYSLYGLLTIIILLGLLRSYAHRLALRQSILLKQKEVELTIKETQQLKEVDELKTRFFTNITHEFKTPLTLIITPVQFLRNELGQTKYAHQLASIERNAHQLLQLINQLMDLSKIEAEAMPVHETYGNPGLLIEQIIASFTELARQKLIKLTYKNKILNNYLFDSLLLERIVYNIVSNALKFTPEGGAISVYLMPNNSGGITFTVRDTGIGIPSEQLSSVFDRFYKVEMGSSHQYEGTGIGLSLVKELVELQRGTVTIESENDSSLGLQGTTVTVDLPYRSVQPLPTGNTDPIKSFVNEESNEETPVILLVEDNAEIAGLIIDCLPAYYYVIWVKNGLEGLSHATSQVPDLIISDVLMPVMDGYTLCRKLKADPRTNHIPIILLTAKTSVDSRLEGLSIGADDYITKPILLNEFQLRVRNLLERQRRLRESTYTTLTTIDQPEITEPFEDPFITKLYSLLETQLDNSLYGVEELASDIGMSRYTLHRKIKTLTTLLPNELVRNYRLKRSIHFLQKGHTIAETATLVGFESSSYFTKCFRNLYGITPKKMVSININS